VATVTDTYGFNSVHQPVRALHRHPLPEVRRQQEHLHPVPDRQRLVQEHRKQRLRDVATVTDTYGFNSVTSQFEPCTDTHCQKCAANKNTCTQCLTASGFYKNTGNSASESVATVTDTYGFNSVTSQFEPCTDTHCQKCAANKNTCTQCLTASGWYKNTGNSACESSGHRDGHLRIQQRDQPVRALHRHPLPEVRRQQEHLHPVPHRQRLVQEHRKQRLRERGHCDGHLRIQQRAPASSSPAQTPTARSAPPTRTPAPSA
jgi:hypothetical protein